PPVYVVLPHFIYPVQQLVPVPGGIIQYGIVQGDGIVNGIPEFPFLGQYRKWRRIVRDQSLRDKGDLIRAWAPPYLGQDTDHVVEIGRGPEPPVPPSGIYGSIEARIARFVLQVQTVDHGGPHLVDA